MFDRYARRLTYEAKGKVASYRVLNTECPKIEVTIAEKGTLKGGIETSETVTYWSIPRPGGAYYAEARIFMVRKDVNEIAIWTGQGIAYHSGFREET